MRNMTIILALPMATGIMNAIWSEIAIWSPWIAASASAASTVTAALTVYLLGTASVGDAPSLWCVTAYLILNTIIWLLWLLPIRTVPYAVLAFAECGWPLATVASLIVAGRRTGLSSGDWIAAGMILCGSVRLAMWGGRE